MASLLQTDLKLALKSAFGDRNIDGPLLVTDWCKGHNQVSDGGVLGDGYSAECGMSETRDSSTSVGITPGEPISPSLSSTSGPSILRGILVFMHKVRCLSRCWMTDKEYLF